MDGRTLAMERWLRIPRFLGCLVLIPVAVATGGSSRVAGEEWVRTECPPIAPSLWDRKSLFNWCAQKEDDPKPDDGKEEEEEEDVICTDRPNFTESPFTVGRGRVQFEAGFTRVSDRTEEAHHKGDSYPELLLRTGLVAEWLELRVGMNYSRATDGDTEGTSTARGFNDTYIGLKIALTEQEGWLPHTAILPQATLPTGSATMSEKIVKPGVNFLYTWDLNDDIALCGSTQGNRAQNEDALTYVEVAQSFSLECSLTDDFSWFGEWFAFFPTSDLGVDPQHYVDTGVMYLVNNAFQLDARVGLGLNEAADDSFWGVGASYKY
jgi:hypothetical protein